MPEISRFFGIVIRMYVNDHYPPHFHVRYGEYKAILAIDAPVIVEGHLPPRALGLVIEWASQHPKLAQINFLPCQMWHDLIFPTIVFSS